MACWMFVVCLHHKNAQVATGALQYWRLAVFCWLLLQSCVSATLHSPFLTCLSIRHAIISLHEWIVLRFIHMKASMCMFVLHQESGTLFLSWYEYLAFSLGIYSDHMFTKAVADIVCLLVCKETDSSQGERVV